MSKPSESAFFRMRVNRRDLCRMLAGVPLLQVASAQSGTFRFARREGGVLEWTIGNESFAQTLSLGRGSLFCAALRDLRTNREWIHPSETSDEFLVALGGSITVTGKTGWTYVSHRQDKAGVDWHELAITVRSAEHGLRVTRFYRWHNVLPIVRQWTEIENESQARREITQIDTFRLRVDPMPEPLELRWMNNFGRAMVPNPGDPIHYRSIDDNVDQLVHTGPYSPDCAWFSLSAPALNEGLVGGWEWSGPMAVGFGGSEDPCLIHGGLDPMGMREPLVPDGAMKSPVGWYGFFQGDQDEAAALCHELVRHSLGPKLPATNFPWVGYCTWATAIDEARNPFNEPGTHPWFPTEKNVLSQVQAAAELGCELFLWDYGWFPRVGDWWFDASRFPQGPKPVARAVHERGMKLGLWFGFGNATNESRVVREHPDWLAEYNHKPIPDDFFIRTGASTWKTRILCLAHRPAREWVKEQLARTIEAAELDWLKHDFDLITICQSRHHTHTPGDGRIAACEGFYEIMDFVRSRYSNLVCEHWMNDSATPDFGVLQRHHVQLIGDAYQAFSLRQMVYGHCQMFPLDRQHRYLRLEDSEGDLTNSLQSSMLGGPWTLLSDPRLLDPQRKVILNREIGVYKRFRHLFATAKVYRLVGRPHPRGWDATQLWDEARGEGIVYAFRSHHPSPRYWIVLKGLTHQAKYQAEFIRAARTVEAAGSTLLAEGLRVDLPDPGTCELISLRRA